MNELPEILKDTALISNSGSLLGSNQGSLIDSYKYVARFNNYRLSPHLQKDVGSKVNIWITSLCFNIEPRNEDFDLVLIINPKNRVTKHQKRMVSKYKTIYMPSNLYYELDTTHARQHAENPSTGLFMIWWLRNELGYFNPQSHFGFDFFGKVNAGERSILANRKTRRGGSNTHHYYEDWRPLFNTHNHNHEKRLYNAISEGFTVKHKISIFNNEYVKNLWMGHEKDIEENNSGFGLI